MDYGREIDAALSSRDSIPKDKVLLWIESAGDYVNREDCIGPSARKAAPQDDKSGRFGGGSPVRA